MTPEQLEDIYGELYPYSDRKVGETITFRDPVSELQYRAEILWVQAPGQLSEGGQHYPMAYIVNEQDPDTGQLFAVEVNDIVR